MSWIDYYGLLVCLWILFCLLMILFKKTRAVGLSFSISTAVLFIGLTVLQNYYGTGTAYNVNKKEKFFEFLQGGEQVSLNLVPSSWLQDVDGRGSNSIIPFEYRKQIGITFPLGSAPSVKTLYCAEDDGFVSYVTDRFGFRNEDHLWNSSAHDILILGDSVAESACIPTRFQNNFSQKLKVVSLGKGGNGPLTSLAAFIEYNSRFRARKVYFFVVSNDYSRPASGYLAIDLERELLEPELNKFLVETTDIQDYFNEQYLKSYKTFAVQYSETLANSKPDGGVAYFFRNVSNLGVTYFFRSVSNLFFYKFIKSIFKSQQLENNVQKLRFIDGLKLEQVYKRAIHTASSSSSKLIFVPLPDKYSSCNQDSKKLFVDDLLAGLNANVLDVWNDLCNKKFFANNGDHFNKLGYKILADRIEEDFLKN